MEELRSVEVLDKEIQADARKKAEKILANADAESQQFMAAVADRAAAARKEKEVQTAKKIDLFAKDVDAALPLEKQRYLVAFEGSAVMSAMNAYLAALSDDKKTDLFTARMEKAKPVIAGKKLHASVYGIDVKKAEKLLKKVFGSDLAGVKEIAFAKSGENGVAGLTVHEGMIVETDDRAVRCRFTTDEIVAELIDKYSYELTSTLFGGRLPE